MFKNPEQILDDIIFEIQNVSEACRWYIRIEKLSELLTISKEDFFRKIYNFKTSKPDRENRNGFSEIDGDYLCEFLHYCLDIQGVQDKFAQAGLYFDERALYELRENFKFIVQDSLSKHNLDKDTLMLLATATIDFDDAVDSYISEKFELDFFVQRSIFDFMSMRKIQTEGGAEIFLKDYLNALIPTKILNLREITREFRDRSYYDLFGEFRKRPSKKKKVLKRENKELTELINYFELEEGFTKDILKKKFKDLLKKYHPDVNKFGLEKTKEIIEKYNRLVIIMNDSRVGSY
ncbi:molecular chaperone DnaJ [Leptospira sp. GIMC2001]|uniref:molecular chaperone DnaJ n=1 Tax=Leptospira sp. GIMC2001 TaxID=1513297 RepID=UPI00234B9465|nr:molecular chaperone DnaJ [Leptospira sp. GIMC2001]WCL48771.1 molecular chaperone DnaJ [Leptospira sp. GIMC2001]